jgi:trehalose-phosphatase
MTADSKPNARPHWTSSLEEIREQLRSRPRILVASDFDGTLSPIVEHHQDAALEATAPAVLEALGRLFPRVQLAFLSGRSLEDLASRLGTIAPRAILAGNHGLEIAGCGFDWTHPSLADIRRDLDELSPRLHRLADAIAGAEVEDKGASITLHYRRVREGDLPALVSFLQKIEIPDRLRLHEGKKVFEFRTDVDWNKGHALREIATKLDLSDAAIVFLGDDVTDEDAFLELGSEAITVYVGDPRNPSAARFNVHDPQDAVRFLREAFANDPNNLR